LATCAMPDTAVRFYLQDAFTFLLLTSEACRADSVRKSRDGLKRCQANKTGYGDRTNWLPLFAGRKGEQGP
jgi:hypothetical protein